MTQCDAKRHKPYGSHLFFFNDPATTEIYTLSLHDALPISLGAQLLGWYRDPRVGAVFQYTFRDDPAFPVGLVDARLSRDRKSTRLNSSHGYISYAVFCLKKKNSGVDNVLHLTALTPPRRTT